jgi:hypothetical protein
MDRKHSKKSRVLYLKPNKREMAAIKRHEQILINVKSVTPTEWEKAGKAVDLLLAKSQEVPIPQSHADRRILAVVKKDNSTEMYRQFILGWAAFQHLKHVEVECLL